MIDIDLLQVWTATDSRNLVFFLNLNGYLALGLGDTRNEYEGCSVMESTPDMISPTGTHVNAFTLCCGSLHRSTALVILPRSEGSDW